ncbi:MAG TPA: hypothetical protein VM283_05330 [Armatimonadota bacterium]|nr:hypothetical protein [Armatimonadota bacterium]
MRRVDVLAIVIMAVVAAVWLPGCPRDEQVAQTDLPPAPGQPAETSVAPAQPTPGAAAPAAPQPATPSASAATPPAPSASTPAPAPAQAPPAASAPAPASPGASATPASSAPVATPTPASAPTPSSPAPAAPKGTVVIGRITVVSHVPEPSEVPYTDCLTMVKYTVESVLSGSYGEKELLAAFWGMKAAKLQPAARFQVGQRHRLVIEPLAGHPDLARAMQADDTNEYTLAPQWVLEYASL